MLCTSLCTNFCGNLEKQAKPTSHVHSLEALAISATYFQALLFFIIYLYVFNKRSYLTIYLYVELIILLTMGTKWGSEETADHMCHWIDVNYYSSQIFRFVVFNLKLTHLQMLLLML